MPINTCVFDAYGTLFDVTAAARRAAQEPGQEALARVWQKTAWVNRAGDPMDRLPWRPAHVLPDLTSIPELAEAL